MVRTKVFVGNLSFATKENELAKEFEVSGKVISANIITRGPRSLGYGFVEMDSEADAQNAVKLLDKKEIDGRPINVEVAKAREEGGNNNGAENNGGRGGERGRGRGGSRGGRGAPRGGGFQPRGGDQQQGGFSGGFRRRQFRRREDGEGGSDEEGQEGNEGEGERRRGGFRGGRGGRGTRGSRGGRGGFRGGVRPRSEERREENRTPSTTTLFIANLPFGLDDEGFGKVFKDSSLAFKTAHVVKRKSGRSKGYGFAEFDNEGDQQNALTALNNKEIEGRQLAVKVALTEVRDETNTNNVPTSPVQSPAATTTNTTTEVKTEKPSTPKTDKK